MAEARRAHVRLMPGRPAPTRALDAARARALGFHSVDPVALPPEPDLPGRLDPAWSLASGLLAWRRMGGATVVLTSDPAEARRHLGPLQAALGEVRLAHAEPARLARALTLAVARPLAAEAERMSPGPESCRTLRPMGQAGLAAGLLLLAGAGAAPLAALAALALLAALLLVATSLLKLAALAASLRRDACDRGADVFPARLPVISLLVPLFQEREVAGTLLARLAALDYPRDLLDVCLVLEDDDARTRAALEAAALPPWAQIVAVPAGTLRTKPRALNYALPFARGSVLGIYDAEDLPGRDHLRRVAARFARRGPEVACLQGVLDYYNARANWLARCFTLEYASWFRVLLPGIARMGLVVPLGGTTLFLRRTAIEAVGGWDAHNVTEDCDLGIRLARRGYHTEMLGIATLEEANARAWPWIRQRSRWLKGYALTYASHMRDPRALLRDLGIWRFLGLQVLVGGTVLQFALAPVLWSFWLVPLGLPHPLAPALSPPLLVALAILFLGSQVLDFGIAALGARRAGRGRLALWAPALQAYFPLATVAVYRALWEAALCPFRWDKTAHGIHAPPLLLTRSPRRA